MNNAKTSTILGIGAVAVFVLSLSPIAKEIPIAIAITLLAAMCLVTFDTR